MTNPSLPVLARRLVNAAEAMRMRWAESDADVRRDELWRPLHEAADDVREHLDGAANRDVVERLAIHLRQMDAEDACHLQPYTLTAEQTWTRASEVLRDGYRATATRILSVLWHLPLPNPNRHPHPEGT